MVEMESCWDQVQVLHVWNEKSEQKPFSGDIEVCFSKGKGVNESRWKERSH